MLLFSVDCLFDYEFEVYLAPMCVCVCVYGQRADTKNMTPINGAVRNVKTKFEQYSADVNNL